MAKRLSSLLAALDIAPESGVDPEIAGVTEDSRLVDPGYIFVAIPGTVDSGALHVDDAVRRGASVIVSETPMTAAVPVMLVPNARKALGDLAAAFFDFPARQLRCFGVTGTDGKTTTSYLLASILRHAGLATGLITTVETQVGGRSFSQPNRLTTPSSPAIQRTLAEMIAMGDQCAAIECSSHALVQERLRQVELRAAAVTNVASDHIEFHGSQSAYEEAKSRIGRLVGPGDYARIVVNHDDAGAQRVAIMTGLDAISYGLGDGAALRATAIETSPRDSSFTVRWEDRVSRVTLVAGGRHNVANALAAIGLALCAPLDFEVAVEGLVGAVLPPGRMQRIEEGQPFDVYVDYAHTEQAFGMTLFQLSEVARDRGGQLIAVFGAAGDRDHAKRPRFAKIAAETCGFFVITNEDPYSENRESIATDIAAGAPIETRGSQWTVEMDRWTAIERAFSQARPRDVVVITGKGHEQSIVEAGVAAPWSDVDAARQILASIAGSSM
jgi:UDP-N-acetylmuramoyl-L-alanyl-D-glutamate--2,6-diaminopimelate ligase